MKLTRLDMYACTAAALGAGVCVLLLAFSKPVVRWFQVQRCLRDLSSSDVDRVSRRFEYLAYDEDVGALSQLRNLLDYYDEIQNRSLRLVIVKIVRRRTGFPHLPDDWEQLRGSEWKRFLSEWTDEREP